MIILNEIKSKDYDEKILNGNNGISDYVCPKCNAKGSMIRHADYERNVITFEDDTVTYSNLTILRVKCKSCGSTHALLPGNLIPYKQFDYSTFIAFLKNYFIYEENASALSKKFNISFQNIYSFINTFLIFKDSTFVTLKIMEIVERLFKANPSSLIKSIQNEIGFNKFILNFNKINNWPFLMTKFHNDTTSSIFIGFK